MEFWFGSDPNHPGSTPAGHSVPRAGSLTPNLRLCMGKPQLAGSGVSFHTPVAGPIDLSVPDVQGRVVCTLLQGTCEAGDHAATWGGKGANGQPANTGMYFFNLTAAGQRESRKILVTR